METFLRRFRILALASVAAIVGAIVPVLGMLWITWALAISDEEALLTLTAQRVLIRADRAARDANQTFEALSRTTLTPCSPAHIDLMRQLVFNTRTIEEIGRFENGQLTCTSWGPVDTPIPYGKPDFETASGLGVTLNVRPALPGGATKLALSRGDYNVLVDPARFIDVVAPAQISMGLATAQGQLIAQSEGAPARRVATLAQTPSVGMDDDLAFSAIRSGDWTAIAVEPRPGFLSTLRREQLILLPIALFLACFIVTLVVWQSRRRLSLANEIRTAIRHAEFEVHYQPILELASGRCVGAEALVRWRRHDGSWVAPALFIPVAEQSGVIGEITALVIERVGTDLGPALARDPTLHISINLAPVDLTTDVVLTRLQALTQRHGIDPAQVWIEVTERGVMDYEASRDIISRLREAGHRLSIDDFGTGYSSLSHLQQITFDALKIDKSFVDTIGVPSAKSAVIFHIIAMAKALGVSMVAEGVEHAAQADYLREHGVQFVQGWLYSRALPPDEFRTWVAGNRQACALG